MVPPGSFQNSAAFVWSAVAPAKPAAEQAAALGRLHAAFRGVRFPTPHFTDRVAEARGILENPGESPELPGGERQFLLGTLEASITAITLRHRPEQALHGEPHPGNVLSTDRGPLFIDLETFCRGPVEFDLAHAPQSVATFYPGIDGITLTHCRRLMLALELHRNCWRAQRGSCARVFRATGKEGS